MSRKLKGFLSMCFVAVTVLYVATTLKFQQPVTQTAVPPQMANAHGAAKSILAKPKKRKQRTRAHKNDADTEELIRILETRLERYDGPKQNWTKVKCKKGDARSKSCFDTNCPAQFSPSPRERLKQVLSVRNPIPAKYLQALSSAARPVTSHKYIFVTGASSNHYNEMQAMMYTAFNSLFPRMKNEDFTFVVYNLGLTEEERRLTKKNCRCTLVDFPFSDLPDFVSQLKCYVWKPLIVASLLHKAEYLIWIDASIRFRRSDPFPEMFKRARENGFQSKRTWGSIAVRTKASMASFFGDHLCQYSAFSEMEANFMIWYNDKFTREAIVKPWLSCALEVNCMCIHNYTNYLDCRPGPPRRVYERCHRFDQSGMGIIFSKLYLGSRPMLFVPNNKVQIKRRTTMDFFTD